MPTIRTGGVEPASRQAGYSVSAAAVALLLGAVAASAQSLLFFVAAVFLVLPLVSGTAAGLGGLRSLPAWGLAVVTLALFAASFALIDDEPANQDGEISPWLNAVLLLIPSLLVVALSMTVYTAVRAYRSTRRAAL